MATAAELYELLQQQDFRCALSGLPLTVKNSELEHRIPLSRGGTNDVDNLQWVRADINRMKGTISQARFIKLCRRVARHHANRPSQSEL